MANNKNQRVDRSWRSSKDTSCLKKHNYATGAGWKTKRRAKIGGIPATSDRVFAIRRKKRG